jgi:type II secretory ATPase GspE/PulE/Tfp pilus assembly ATPase PilB-like protein
MSWNGYVAWLQEQQERFQHTLENRPAWEARDLAERSLFRLHRTGKLAERKGCSELWEELLHFFREGLNQVEELENQALYGWTSRPSKTARQSAAKQRLAKAEAEIKAGRFEGGLEILRDFYDRGRRDFFLVRQMVECLDKLNKPQEIVDLVTHLLMDKEYEAEEQAQLYYRLGLSHYKLGKLNQARQALWRIRQIAPKFPGLEDKLQEIEKKRRRTRTRYDILLEKNLLDHKQLEEARQKARQEDEDLDQLLIAQYNVPKDELGTSLSAFYDVPYTPFDSSLQPPFEIFEKRRLDPDFLKRYGWVPLEQNGTTTVILMVNPFDLGKIDEIRFILGTSRIETNVGLKQDVEGFIDSFFRELSGGEELAEFDEEVEAGVEQEEESPDVEETMSGEDSEVVRLVNALLIEAWKRGASDIHVEPNPISKYCSIRFRVDGTCHEFRKLRYSLSRPLVSRIKIMAKLDIAERRLPQDGKVKLKLPQVNKVVEFRVATMPSIDGQEDLVLRVLASGKPLPLEQLGLLEGNLKTFREMIYQPYGMVLVVGPTGSGKTTTLHSALRYINVPERKIWTAEDPVEITQEGLRQVQMNPKIGLNFAAALRSFLRLDPDVIMIGEMRDQETAHIGIEASLTGHLVFSTLHTNTAPETLTRLLDMDIDPFNFADSLLCVLAQRLVKTLCPKCKEEYTPGAGEIEALRTEFGPGFDQVVGREFLDKPILFRATGCKQCIQGYKGRVGIHELLANNEQIKNQIKFNKPTEEIRDQAKQDGMLSLKQDGIMKIVSGLTDIHQVRTVAGKG